MKEAQELLSNDEIDSLLELFRAEGPPIEEVADLGMDDRSRHEGPVVSEAETLRWARQPTVQSDQRSHYERFRLRHRPLKPKRKTWLNRAAVAFFTSTVLPTGGSLPFLSSLRLSASPQSTL